MKSKRTEVFHKTEVALTTAHTDAHNTTKTKQANE